MLSLKTPSPPWGYTMQTGGPYCSSEYCTARNILAVGPSAVTSWGEGCRKCLNEVNTESLERLSTLQLQSWQMINSQAYTHWDVATQAASATWCSYLGDETWHVISKVTASLISFQVLTKCLPICKLSRRKGLLTDGGGSRRHKDLAVCQSQVPLMCPLMMPWWCSSSVLWNSARAISNIMVWWLSGTCLEMVQVLHTPPCQ